MSASLGIFIDGSDVTNCALRGSWTPRLNRPAQATVTLPMDCAIGDVGSRLMLTLDTGGGPVIVFHGFVLVCETDAGTDTGETQYNAQDPMELWQWRPVRDDDGDFSKPRIIEVNQTADAILLAALSNTVSNTGNPDHPNQGQPPHDAEGPIFLDLGGIPGCMADCSGAPADWPMTIAELASLMISTGQLDLVITPTDPGGGVMGTLDFYCGDYGTDLSGSLVFSYGMGAYNVDSLRWNRDMTNVVNKYWLYAGPRVATAGDTAGDQHWCFNVTGFSDVFDPAGPGALVPPGGKSVDDSNTPIGPPWTNNQVGERAYNSRVSYGVRMKVDIFDGYDDNCVQGVGTPGKLLQQRLWQEYQWITATPREIIHITPTRDTEIGTFGIGDLVGVEATSAVRGGFSGVQRIYEYTLSWDEDSVLAIGELQTSSDADF